LRSVLGRWTLILGRWRSQVGRWRLEVGGWTLGRWRLEVGTRRLDLTCQGLDRPGWRLEVGPPWVGRWRDNGSWFALLPTIFSPFATLGTSNFFF